MTTHPDTTALNDMTANEATLSRAAKTGWLSRLSAENLALAISVIAGFLVFSGQGYYDQLFADFAVRPGIIEISQADLITKGVECSVYALLKIVLDNWFAWLLGGLAGICIGIIISVALIRSSIARNAAEIASPIVNFINWLTPISLRWAFGLLITCAGLLAGTNGGKIDAASIQRVRMKFPNCFSIGGALYRGHILAQDKDRTILVQSRRTSIIKTADISYITACRPST